MKSIFLLFTLLLAFTWPLYAKVKPETLKKIKALYLELQSFKNDSLFAQVGFTPYCRYGRWYKKVRAITADDSIDQRLELGDGSSYFPASELNSLSIDLSPNPIGTTPLDNADTRESARKLERVLDIKSPPPNAGRQVYLTSEDRLCSLDQETLLKGLNLLHTDTKRFAPLYLSGAVSVTNRNIEVFIEDGDLYMLKLRAKGTDASYWCTLDAIQDCSFEKPTD